MMPYRAVKTQTDIDTMLRRCHGMHGGKIIAFRCTPADQPDLTLEIALPDFSVELIFRGVLDWTICRQPALISAISAVRTDGCIRFSASYTGDTEAAVHESMVVAASLEYRLIIPLQRCENKQSLADLRRRATEHPTAENRRALCDMLAAHIPERAEAFLLDFLTQMLCMKRDGIADAEEMDEARALIHRHLSALHAKDQRRIASVIITREEDDHLAEWMPYLCDDDHDLEWQSIMMVRHSCRGDFAALDVQRHQVHLSFIESLVGQMVYFDNPDPLPFARQAMRVIDLFSSRTNDILLPCRITAQTKLAEACLAAKLTDEAIACLQSACSHLLTLWNLRDGGILCGSVPMLAKAERTVTCRYAVDQLHAFVSVLRTRAFDGIRDTADSTIRELENLFAPKFSPVKYTQGQQIDCPPNSLECDVIDAIIQAQPEEIADILRAQWNGSTSCTRTVSARGFLLRFSPPKPPRKPSGNTKSFDGPHVSVLGLRRGMGFILWVEDGSLCLEGFTYEEELPEEIPNYTLYPLA